MFISVSYPSVLEVSSIEAGVTAQIIAVCALPPSDDCSILVSLLSRKFTYWLQCNHSIMVSDTEQNGTDIQSNILQGTNKKWEADDYNDDEGRYSEHLECYYNAIMGKSNTRMTCTEGHIRGLFKKYRTFGRQKYNYFFGCLKP